MNEESVPLHDIGKEMHGIVMIMAATPSCTTLHLLHEGSQSVVIAETHFNYNLDK